MSYTSRRSPVYSTPTSKGMVSTSQPLATTLGCKMLSLGANAYEASITVAAALALLEPCSTGLGGDMFCLLYNGSTKSVTGLNGSGRSPLLIPSLKNVIARVGITQSSDDENSTTWSDASHPLSVTVPGAAQGWFDLYTRYKSGTFTFLELLQPVIDLCYSGVVISGPITSTAWDECMFQIRQWSGRDGMEHLSDWMPFTVDGINPPKQGELYFNKELGDVLTSLATCGPKDGFYNGPTGRSIVCTLNKLGSPMSMTDLTSHESEWIENDDLISTEYKGFKLWEVGSNTSSVCALLAVDYFRVLQEEGLFHFDSGDDSGEYKVKEYHAKVECMRLAFHDTRAIIEDKSQPDHAKAYKQILNNARTVKNVLSNFNPTKSNVKGKPISTSCTVSFQVHDSHGNAVSFVNSNYEGFGTGIVCPSTGFSLQNRGSCFRLEGSVNLFRGGKRSFHTIIPAIITKNVYIDEVLVNELHASLTNMGGFMQPTGHFLLLTNLIDKKLNAQEAVDALRFCIDGGVGGGEVYLEEGIDKTVVERLVGMGHNVGNLPPATALNLIDYSQIPLKGNARQMFGKAQIIRVLGNGGLEGGSDMRADGCAMIAM